jgi:hypothetical protein
VKFAEHEPVLPVNFEPVSNGEYLPEVPDPLRLEMERRAHELTADSAARLGVSRRTFLRSLSAMAATLWTIDSVTANALGIPAGCWYPMTKEACIDESAATGLFADVDFVFDVQGHLLEYELDPSTAGDWFWGRQFPQARCEDEDDPRACFTMNHFLEEVFVRSDTTMVALSGLPILPEGSPLPAELMEETRRVVAALSGDERVLVNAQALPQVTEIDALLEEMDRTVAENEIHGWKTFTHFPVGMPWRLDDRDPDLPQVAGPFLQKLVELGTPTLFVHKGLSDGARAGSPEDIGPAAMAHPDVRFAVYHSGFEVAHREGQYAPEPARGVDRLVKSLADAGVGPGSNVYAEIGSTWWHLMRRPDEAAHVLGKLLLAVGEDNLLWGTDSIFYGSPQSQIDAFRAFEIPAAWQERFGYPALTAEVKRKVLGRNAARLYDVTPVTSSAVFGKDEIEEARRSHPVPNLTWGPKTNQAVRQFREHHQGWP